MTKEPEYLTTETRAGMAACLKHYIDYRTKELEYLHLHASEGFIPSAVKSLEIMVLGIVSGSQYRIKNPKYVPKPKPKLGEVWIIRDEIADCVRRAAICRILPCSVDAIHKPVRACHYSRWLGIPLSNLIEFTGKTIDFSELEEQA